jgi:hypothetical protein
MAWITLLAVFLFYRAAGNNWRVLLILLGWLAVQGVITLTHFYVDTMALPPRFLLLILPPVITIIVLLLFGYDRRLDAGKLTLLHIVRFPVELVLYHLYLDGLVPGLMTFCGWNPDILSGLTAPFIWYFGYVKPRLPVWLLITWNIVCLLLLMNIVAIAVLSAPTPFQQLAFEQPNVALMHFPYSWLPACVVPLVLLAHLAVLLKIRRQSVSSGFNPLP